MVRKTKQEAEKTRQQLIDAARRVFHERGVSKSTLEVIAAAAGVTRGAVYWHFKNKIDLFYTMRAQVVLPLVDRIDNALLEESLGDSLGGIEHALCRMLTELKSDKVAWEVFRIATLRCEYVDELMPVLDEFEKHHAKRVEKFTKAYRRAKAQGTLRDGLDPRTLALDTIAFLEGIMRRVAIEEGSGLVTRNIRKLIRAHMALRRK